MTVTVSQRASRFASGNIRSLDTRRVSASPDGALQKYQNPDVWEPIPAPVSAITDPSSPHCPVPPLPPHHLVQRAAPFRAVVLAAASQARLFLWGRSRWLSPAGHGGGGVVAATRSCRRTPVSFEEHPRDGSDGRGEPPTRRPASHLCIRPIPTCVSCPEVATDSGAGSACPPLIGSMGPPHSAQRARPPPGPRTAYVNRSSLVPACQHARRAPQPGDLDDIGARRTDRGASLPRLHAVARGEKGTGAPAPRRGFGSHP